MRACRWFVVALYGLLYVTCGTSLRLYKPTTAHTYRWKRYSSMLSNSISSVQPPMKVLLLVEPTPFNYISGYANRFKEMLKHLKHTGDEVRIITPDSDPNPPKEYMGFPIISPRGFQLPIYKKVTITLDFARNIPIQIRAFKPDLIHVSSPSCIAGPAILWSRLLNIPLVMSYHTDIAGYAKSYFPSWISGIIATLCKLAMRIMHHFADLTLCTSPQLKESMEAMGVKRVDVWQKGINTEIFSPKYRDKDMRYRLSEGHPEAPLLLYVGRLGSEKRIHRLKKVLERNPGSRLVIVGTGPVEEELKRVFAGLPVHFAGEIVGEELSRAFASCDIFTMPSDTETLGFVVMEALASGLPTVGVNAGGVVDIIEDGNTGFLAENCDEMEEFSAQVGKLIADKALLDKMRVAAVAWAQGWSWRAATDKLRNVQYKMALATHAARNGKGNKALTNGVISSAA